MSWQTAAIGGVAVAWGTGTALALRWAPPGLAGFARTPGPGGQRAAWGRAGVAALGGLVCLALALATGARPELVVWLLLVPLALLLARIDLAVRRLPDVLTLPAAPVTAALLGLAALVPGHHGSWGRALLGGLVLGAVYLVLLLINPAGLGFGDVKLAPTLGLALGWYGWPVLFAGMFAGFVLGAFAGVILLLTGSVNRRTPIPFGPFMLLGALGGVLLGAR